jgi:hypothetical protein
MVIRLPRTTLLAVAGALLFTAGWVAGQEKARTEKTLIWAAAWTAADTMTPAAFEALKTETASLVGRVPGLKRVWVGKLLEPKTFDGVTRNYGMVLEFDSVASKNAYTKLPLSPWRENFNKLRTPRSSNFDVVGE